MLPVVATFAETCFTASVMVSVPITGHVALEGDHIVILLTVPSLIKIRSGDVVFTAFLTVPAESVTVATAVEATVNVLVVTESIMNCPL